MSQSNIPSTVEADISQIMDAESQRRWRLILGSDADGKNGSNGENGSKNPEQSTRKFTLSEQDLRRDKALSDLYNQEFSRRGGTEVSMPLGVRWLNESRTLFPQPAVEILQRDALERYGMTGLLSDPEVLQQATPNLALVQTLLAVREHIPHVLLEQVRNIIRKVIKELEQQLEPRLQSIFANRRLRHGRGGRPRLVDLDWKRTLRHNLKHYQPEQQQLILERLFFFPRSRHQLPWHLWLVVDQSGSMADSMIYSAVIAGIFARLPSIKTRLLLFDTDVVDVSDQLHAPEEILLGAQLGGGTNIGCGLAAAAAQIEQPHRSMVILISDLEEGYDQQDAIMQSRNLIASGVTLLALTALNEQGETWFDRDMANALSHAGAQVGSKTPDQLVDWFAAHVGEART